MLDWSLVDTQASVDSGALVGHCAVELHGMLKLASPEAQPASRMCMQRGTAHHNNQAALWLSLALPAALVAPIGPASHGGPGPWSQDRDLGQIIGTARRGTGRAGWACRALRAPARAASAAPLSAENTPDPGLAKGPT